MKSCVFISSLFWIEEPKQNDYEEIGLASDVDSCAATVLYEDNRTASSLMIPQNAESVRNDCDNIIVDNPGNSVMWLFCVLNFIPV